jgi:hypothetical protein
LRAGITDANFGPGLLLLGEDRRLGHDLAPSTALVPFLEVTPMREQGEALIEIALGNGRVVRVPLLFDDATLARVLAIADEVAT